MKNILSHLLIFLGVFSIGFAYSLIWQSVNPTDSSFNEKSPEVKKISKALALPKYLLIPDLSINVPIYPSQVKDGIWESTTEGISYLTSSPIPGEWGNSILYGHNWTNILGNLVKAKVGQDIIVMFADGSQKVFEISLVKEVYPYQIEFLKPSEDRRISLYTCSGVMDSKRFVVSAILDETTLLSGNN
ncbi:hypothetical protein A2159_00350 [Candidatus Woesebacteria bacterium RBG_13_34_9]|uniref:Sortase n=1 Tax=Candidatus Woesebacteria bacterium RBG_13_34_9 TaxID=1802477 RepID=A0A1F7X4Y7_9BACT|nr:MAG: hypothetical protein A2159_00350 [Candidatus Woesebacteria bacterium RBG_13_34_9]